MLFWSRVDNTRRLSSEKQKAFMWTRRNSICSAAPITAGVQAEARQQIVGPDSSVISANDGLFSDVKWSSGLREQFGIGIAQVQLKGETKQGCWEEVSNNCKEILVWLEKDCTLQPGAP